MQQDSAKGPRPINNSLLLNVLRTLTPVVTLKKIDLRGQIDNLREGP